MMAAICFSNPRSVSVDEKAVDVVPCPVLLEEDAAPPTPCPFSLETSTLPPTIQNPLQLQVPVTCLVASTDTSCPTETFRPRNTFPETNTSLWPASDSMKKQPRMIFRTLPVILLYTPLPSVPKWRCTLPESLSATNTSRSELSQTLSMPPAASTSDFALGRSFHSAVRSADAEIDVASLSPSQSMMILTISFCRTTRFAFSCCWCSTPSVKAIPSIEGSCFDAGCTCGAAVDGEARFLEGARPAPAPGIECTPVGPQLLPRTQKADQFPSSLFFLASTDTTWFSSAFLPHSSRR
mmetsp:Transcript_9782/g.24089  ORF Transcript_9782/g.24089 Transcript_9782/m.24089 type:complete len:295 (-) Transcript_9782:31-915(-)